MKKKLTYILISIALIFYISCEKNDDCGNQLNFSGTLINSYGCKYTKSVTTAIEIPDTLSCIKYVFNADANQLTINHINAGFNCCPDSLYVQSSLNGNTIIIEELEGGAPCDCSCLFDLEIEINGIEAMKYKIEIKEPYTGDQQEIIFAADLTNIYEGEFCVTRKNYPWGVNNIQ